MHVRNGNIGSRSACLGLVLGFTLVIGCAESPVDTGAAADPLASRFVITNDEAALAKRVVAQPQDTLQIAPVGAAGAMRDGGGGRDITLHLVGESQVLPPEISGKRLQASHIVTWASRAYVGYNVAGPERFGGIDVFRLNDSEAKLISQAVAAGVDVGAVGDGHTEIYLAAAFDGEDLASPAALVEIALSGGKLTDEIRVADLPSYAATSVVREGDDVFVTTGSSEDGGLFRLDAAGLGVTTVDNHLDARGVAVGADRVVTMSGTPGTVRVYDLAGTPLGTYEIGGASAPEAKSMVVVADGFAYAAAGEAGIVVLRVSDGAVVAEVPMAAMTDDVTADAVTNGIAVNKDLLFAANGGAGLFALRIGMDNGIPVLDPIGQVVMPGASSVNAVASHSNRLFVATGNGGLQIIRIASR